MNKYFKYDNVVTSFNLTTSINLRSTLQMGFQEMTTNRWVESSFWNFDSLFQPQQHPAREVRCVGVGASL